MPRKDEVSKVPSPASKEAAGNKAILAVIDKQGLEVAKVTSLVEDLKKSMEGRLDSIESCLSALQKGHSEAEQCLNDVDEALSSADTRITTLEATCKEVRDANSLLKAKVNELEGRSRRLNICIVGVKEEAEGPRPSKFVS